MCAFCVRTTLHVFFKTRGRERENPPFLVTGLRRFFFQWVSLSFVRFPLGSFRFFLFTSIFVSNSCQGKKESGRKKSKHLSVFFDGEMVISCRRGTLFALWGFSLSSCILFTVHVILAQKKNFYFWFSLKIWIFFKKSFSLRPWHISLREQKTFVVLSL